MGVASVGFRGGPGDGAAAGGSQVVRRAGRPGRRNAGEAAVLRGGPARPMGDVPRDVGRVGAKHDEPVGQQHRFLGCVGDRCRFALVGRRFGPRPQRHHSAQLRTVLGQVEGKVSQAGGGKNGSFIAPDSTSNRSDVRRNQRSREGNADPDGAVGRRTVPWG